MKKRLSILLAVSLILLLAACAGEGGRDPAGSKAAAGEPEIVADDAQAADTASNNIAAAPPAESEAGDPVQSHNKVLVAVFSATGTTRGIAEKIAAITGADLYEITAAEPYSADDLNYHDRNSRSTKEQNDKSARPEIGSEALDLGGYTTVYLGFPIWWGEEPRILDTFVESYTFDGITMIPFCTSSSSGIGRSGQNLADNAGSGDWLEGKRFSGSVTEADLQAWIDSLK